MEAKEICENGDGGEGVSIIGIDCNELANGFKDVDLNDEKENCPNGAESSTSFHEKENEEYSVCVKTDEVLGRYLVASRDIKCHEVLMRDRPVLISPNAEVEPTCLGCCVRICQPEKCSKCGWPICGLDCEKIPEHANYECEIFSKNEIKPDLPSPYSFIAAEEYIKILRCLLLKVGNYPGDKEKWDLLMTLEAHVEARKSIPRILFMSSLVTKFIRDYCKLDQFDAEMINYILGIVDVNAFRYTIHPDNPLRQIEAAKSKKDVDRNATFIYTRGAMVAHGCKRNVRWETLPNGDLEMRSAEDIKKGQTLTHPYVDLMLGTPDRRRQLKDQFYFECSCARCTDPTEFGTYFSALKCPECKPGYLLAVNPLDFETDWKCNNSETCECRKSSEYERDIVKQIQSEEKTILEMLEFGTNIAIIGGLARILGKYQGRKVHQNHYSMIDIEYNLVKRMAKMTKHNVDLVHEMKRLIHKFLDMANIFYPGIK